MNVTVDNTKADFLKKKKINRINNTIVKQFRYIIHVIIYYMCFMKFQVENPGCLLIQQPE
jgi:hypothetical protein